MIDLGPLQKNMLHLKEIVLEQILGNNMSSTFELT